MIEKVINTYIEDTPKAITFYYECDNGKWYCKIFYVHSNTVNTEEMHDSWIESVKNKLK